MDPYRFDKTAFKIKTYEEADADKCGFELIVKRALAPGMVSNIQSVRV